MTDTPPRAFHSAQWDLADCHAIKAVAAGTADEAQQKRAIEWIILKACRAYEVSFYPDDQGGARDTDFALGRQFVGQQIVKLINASRELLEQSKKRK